MFYPIAIWVPFKLMREYNMKKTILAAIVIMLTSVALMTNVAMATPPTPTVTSVMDGSISVGTFVSAAPGQYQNQTSTGSLTGSTTITHAATAPVITSSIVGTASSVSSGTGVTYPSFSVNNIASSAVTQGIVTTTVSNFAIPVTSITPVNHNHNDD